MAEYYWELIQHDGTRIEIPPDGVAVVKRRWDAGQPIHTARQGSIPHNQIKAFRPTEKPYTVQPLLDAAAQAFNDPQITENGEIRCRWVKKNVTQDRWHKFYSHHQYRRIGEDSGMVTVAYKLPVHQIDVNTTAYCTDDEIADMQRKY